MSLANGFGFGAYWLFTTGVCGPRSGSPWSGTVPGTGARRKQYFETTLFRLQTSSDQTSLLRLKVISLGSRPSVDPRVSAQKIQVGSRFRSWVSCVDPRVSARRFRLEVRLVWVGHHQSQEGQSRDESLSLWCPGELRELDRAN